MQGQNGEKVVVDGFAMIILCMWKMADAIKRYK